MNCWYFLQRAHSKNSFDYKNILIFQERWFVRYNMMIKWKSKRGLEIFSTIFYKLCVNWHSAQGVNQFLPWKRLFCLVFGAGGVGRIPPVRPQVFSYFPRRCVHDSIIPRFCLSRTVMQGKFMPGAYVIVKQRRMRERKNVNELKPSSKKVSSRRHRAQARRLLLRALTWNSISSHFAIAISGSHSSALPTWSLGSPVESTSGCGVLLGGPSASFYQVRLL